MGNMFTLGKGQSVSLAINRNNLKKIHIIRTGRSSRFVDFCFLV